MALYEKLGFNNHPFAKTNADEEPNLPDYFVPPPYFEAIVGDSSTPNACVVLAPRGSGKTAQRRMLETHSIGSQFLAVTYDRFEFGAGETVNKITLQYHLRNLLTRILVTFISYVSEYPDLINNLNKNEKKQLSTYLHAYLGDLTGDRLQELLKELKSLPEKFREFWQKNVGFMESVVSYILKTYDLEKIDLPDLRQEEKRLNETYKYQLGKVGLVKQVGTVTVPPATRPVFFYCIVDPLAVRLLHRTIPIDQFLEDRWLPCGNCETDNLSDINLYPGDNVPLCRECGRELV